MSNHSAREAVLNQYAATDKTIELYPPHRGSSRTKGTTLEDFYREVHARSSMHLFSHKDAAEIESMMRHNRTLIDSRQNYRK